MFLRIFLGFFWFDASAYKRVGLSGNILEIVYYTNIWSFDDRAESINGIEDEAGKTITNWFEQSQRIHSIRRDILIYS